MEPFKNNAGKAVVSRVACDARLLAAPATARSA
jgi:hypothetical protein